MLAFFGLAGAGLILRGALVCASSVDTAITRATNPAPIETPRRLTSRRTMPVVLGETGKSHATPRRAENAGVTDRPRRQEKRECRLMYKTVSAPDCRRAADGSTSASAIPRWR